MKRALDITVSLIVLLLLSPLLPALAFLIRISDDAPALLRQSRVGRNGEVFEILKFRTMRPEKGPLITVAGDSRITPIGRGLRRWKLDELPQFWNVLRGEMSLVGPRPEVPEYVRLYTDAQRRVLVVRPGITGPAQLEGINEEEELQSSPDPERHYREVVMPRKLNIDLRYIDNAGVIADLRILYQTLRQILGRAYGAPNVAI